MLLNDYTIKCIKEEKTFEKFYERTIEIIPHKKNKAITVKQYQWGGWPDRKIPDETELPIIY